MHIHVILYRHVSCQGDILIMLGYCMAGTLRNGGGLLIVSTVQRKSWYLYWRELWSYSSTPLMTTCLLTLLCGGENWWNNLWYLEVVFSVEFRATWNSTENQFQTICGDTTYDSVWTLALALNRTMNMINTLDSGPWHQLLTHTGFIILSSIAWLPKLSMMTLNYQQWRQSTVSCQCFSVFRRA